MSGIYTWLDLPRVDQMRKGEDKPIISSMPPSKLPISQCLGCSPGCPPFAEVADVNNGAEFATLYSHGMKLTDHAVSSVIYAIASGVVD